MDVVAEEAPPRAAQDNNPPAAPSKTVQIADDKPVRSGSAIITVSGSGSERLVEVYPPPRRGHSSGGSASVHSPTSSGGRSFSSASTDSWEPLEAPYEGEDEIDPSDSASRSRGGTSRRHTTEARPAPTRRHSSRKIVVEREREELPRRPSHHRHHSSRPRRTESRRTPSDESGSVASWDDYPYSHHGAPQPPPTRAYPPGYRHVPAPPHGGFPPAAAPYPDPFAAHQQALVHMPHHDPFGYQQPNPFSPHSQAPNPFSPMSSVGGTSYFATDPHAPPQPPMAHHHRPAPAPRPQSFVAPSSHYGSEMGMYPHSVSPYPPYGMPGYPPMPPWGYPPPSQTASPAPPKEDKTSAEIESLREFIKKDQEARLAAEEARLAKEKAEAAAIAAKKAEEEADKKRKDEVAAATKKAKEEAEDKAKEAAKKAQEEHEKVLAEAKKKQEEAEKKHKALDEEAKKNKPTPDSLKAPIRFKDAVGRKFSFPWQHCKSWKGMEGLIKQAFLHVDVLGEHVQHGHYDLAGPDGEIILPQVWEMVVQPDWEVSMHMWPMPEEKKDKHHDAAAMAADPFAGLDFGDLNIMDVGNLGRRKSSKKKDGKSKSKHKASSPEIVQVPPMHGVDMGGMMPPPPPPPGGGHGGAALDMGQIFMEQDRRQRPKAKSKGSRDLPLLTQWMVGGQRSKSRR